MRQINISSANGWLLNTWLKKKKKKKRIGCGWASCSIGRKKNIPAVIFLFSYLDMKDNVWTIKLTIPSLRSMEPTVRYSMSTYLRDVHNICCFLSLGWHNPVCNWPRARRIAIRGLLWTREYFHHEYFSDMLSLSKVHLSQFFDILIAVDEKFPLWPRGVDSSFPILAQGAISNIQKVCCRDRNRGFLAVWRSWLRDTGGTAIDSVICDVLLVSRNIGGLHLHSLYNAAYEKSVKYSKKTTQSIKKQLSEMAPGAKSFMCYTTCYHLALVEKWDSQYLTIAILSLMISTLSERNLVKYSKPWW